LAHMLYQERRAAVLRGDRRNEVETVIQSATEARSIMLRSVLRTGGAFLAYVILAVLVLHPTEGWNPADCAYFAIVTLTTVGYGDLTPTTVHGKLLSMVLSVSGLITVTATLNNLINVLMVERKRRQLEASLQQLDNDTTTLVTSQALTTSADPSKATQLPAVSSTEAGETMRWLPLPAWASRALRLAIQWLRTYRPQLRWTLEATSGLLTAIALGTALGLHEGWSLVDSIYFALISILTVGYGDFSPCTPPLPPAHPSPQGRSLSPIPHPLHRSSRLGRNLCTILLPFACAAALRSISVLSSAFMFVDRTAPLNTDGGIDDQIARMERLLSASCAHGSGHGSGHSGARGSGEHGGLISESDFICSTLIELGLVEEEVMSKVREQFYRLDKRAAGILTRASYERMLSFRQGGAKRRWQHAGAMTMQQQRVLSKLRVWTPEVSMSSKAQTPAQQGPKAKRFLESANARANARRVDSDNSAVALRQTTMV